MKFKITLCFINSESQLPDSHCSIVSGINVLQNTPSIAQRFAHTLKMHDR